MSWTDPRTWAVGEVVTATLLNEQLRDNLNALKVTNSDEYTLDESSDYTTTSTSFVDVDATNLALNLTTTGGDILVGFAGMMRPIGSSPRVYFDIDIDGAAAGDDGIWGIGTLNGTYTPLSFTRLFTGITSGAHIIKLQWKVSGGSINLASGAGTIHMDVHPQLWALEV